MTSNSMPPPPPTNALALDPGERRRPGRPRSIRRAPDLQERARHHRVQERLEQFVESDGVVVSTGRELDRTSTATIDVAMLALARECAGLKWEARRAQVEMRPGSEKIASRHTDGLMRLASVLLARERSGPRDDCDPHDPRLHRLVEYFFEVAREAAVETLGPEPGDRFIKDVLARVEGWEKRVG